jgi:glycosyltransferase involved in cell wall biosynthesis
MKKEDKKEDKVQVSIIIPSFNRHDVLSKVLKAFSSQTVPFNRFEILVIDDASTTPLSENIDVKNFPFKLKIFRHSTLSFGKS